MWSHETDARSAGGVVKAVVFAGDGLVAVDDVAEPRVGSPRDAVVKVSRTAICGSDLHLLEGKTPGMRPGSVIGHEFVGVVSDVGDAVSGLAGRRVLGSFLIACGECDSCRAARFNFCRDRRALGLGPLTGDLEGAQAEYVLVPNADVNLLPLDDDFGALEDEAALFGGDILATGYYAAALGNVGPDTKVAVVGAGPVGLFTALACASSGGRVIVLDADPARVRFAREVAGLEAIDVSETDAFAAVSGATDGALADVAFDAVGAIPALKSAMKCVCDGGRVVVVGVYGMERYDLHLGMSWTRGIDLRFASMANVHAHWRDALGAVTRGEIDPTRVITHRMPLDDGVEAYELFRSRRALKVVLSP